MDSDCPYNDEKVVNNIHQHAKKDWCAHHALWRLSICPLGDIDECCRPLPLHDSHFSENVAANGAMGVIYDH